MLKGSFASESDTGLPIDFGLDFDVNDDWQISIGEEDVLRALQTIKANKSQGSDGIKPIFLKLGAFQLCKPLTCLFNRCLQERVFPDRWKRADVCLIPKTNPPSCDDLRPISLLPIMSKIFERLVLKIMRNKLVHSFGSEQFAYRPHGSTTNALVAVHDTVTKMLEDPEAAAVRITQFDLSKAFDRLPHRKLIHYLNIGNFPIGFVLWCKSYLSNRLQRIKIGNLRGKWQPVPCGVPQGSVLGPYLFASFLGHLHFPSTNHEEIFKYADDITLIEKNEKTDLSDEMEHNTNKIVSWIKQNGLKENEKKRNRLLILKKIPLSSSLRSSTTHCLRILGVTWESNL